MPSDAENWKEKKTANIESIQLLTPEQISEKFNGKCPAHSDQKPLATICFKFPCKWTTLTIAELLEIIKLWIDAEEIRYPKQFGYKGRWILFEEIKKIFQDHGINTEEEKDGKKCI